MKLLRRYIRDLLIEQNVQAMGMCFPFAYQKADEWFEAHFTKGGRGRAPKRHPDLNNKDKFKVVHGTITNKWDKPPKPVVHGWVEMGDLIFDAQTSILRPDGIDREFYYDMYQPKPYKEFTAEEAILNCYKYGGEGPWDDELYAIVKQRDAWMNERFRRPRRILREQIDPRIQKQLDVVLGLTPPPGSDQPVDDLAVEVSHFGTTIFRYVQVTGAGTRVKLEGPQRHRGLGHYPWGYVEITRADRYDEHYGPCLNGWVVVGSDARDGFGPLLYDVAMEWASQNGGGLTSDRFEVSGDAEDVWKKYLRNRSDVEPQQLDTLNYPDRQLTPDDPKDDCYQEKAMQVDWDRWHETPFAKLFRKSGTPVISALGKKFIQSKS